MTGEPPAAAQELGHPGGRFQAAPAGIPGPPRDRWAGCLGAFERDRLGFLMEARERYGGLVAFDTNATIVNEPDLAASVLERHHDFIVRGSFLNRRRSVREVCEVEASRAHLNAGLRRSAVETLGCNVAALTEEMAPASRKHAGIGPLPLLEAIVARSVAEFYFGDQAPPVARAITGLLDVLSGIFGNPLAVPAAIPTPANLRVRRSYRHTRAIMDPLVTARVSSPHSSRDYATTVAVSATHAGHALERVVDLLIGSLLAAQRVPAAAAAWTLWHLSRDTALADLVRRGALPVETVILEAVRLHPPTWLIRRVAKADVELGGYRFPAGHNFLLSPYVIHRDPKLFADPEQFRPERWLEPDRNRRGFFAYGQGIHRCPGGDASQAMISGIVTTLVNGFDLSMHSSGVVACPRTTLVPQGLSVTLTPRTRP